MAEEGDESLFEYFLSFEATKAPTNSPYEFLAFCGVLGLGNSYGPGLLLIPMVGIPLAYLITLVIGIPAVGYLIQKQLLGLKFFALTSILVGTGLGLGVAALIMQPGEPLLIWFIIILVIA